MFIWLQKNRIIRLKGRVWNLAFLSMEAILASFLWQHKSHDAWWYYIKMKPSATINDRNKSPKDKVDTLNEYYLSGLLQISMIELWEVLIACGLAKSAGKRGAILDKKKLARFITNHNLGDIVALEEKGKQPVMRIGVYGTNTNSEDHCPTAQWKSGKKQPRPLRDASNKFREDLKHFKLEKEKLFIVHTPTPANTDVPPPLEPIFGKNADPKMDLIKVFLSKILASPDDMNDPSFFKNGVGSSTIGDLLQQTAAEIEKKKEEDEKMEEAVSAALRVETFSENNVLPSNYPFLADLQDSRGRQICLKTNKDIQKLLREIVKMSRQVKSVDLLKVINSNDVTTSLVEVPCSAKQSGFKKQSRRSGWVERILYNVRKNKEKALPIDAADGDEYDDTDDDERAYTNADTARWLMTYLGECYPAEFVKSAQALDMPIHQGKMDAEYTSAMWMDASVGVAAQRIIMKYFIAFFGYKFTVPEGDINKLAGRSVPPVVCTVEYKELSLDWWYKDLVDLLVGQIESEHASNQSFTYDSVDLVVGADHGQGSFRAGVKIIYRKCDGSIVAEAIYGLAEIECPHDDGALLQQTVLPKLNAALKRIINYERDASTGEIVRDGWLSIYKKVEADGRATEGDGLYAVLDRKEKTSENDEEVLKVPIRVFDAAERCTL
jgi:hypothetical protein